MNSGPPTLLPERFLEKLERLYEPALRQRVLESYARPKSTVFRISPLLGEEEAELDQLQTAGFHVDRVPGPVAAHWIPAAERRALTETNAFREGRLFIQNPSSMLAAQALEASPGERLLDLCAAPGGKTLFLAGELENRGEVIAVELGRGRFFKLRALLETHGATCAKAIHRDGRRLPLEYREAFDRVLVDAPCSSESRFRAGDPDSWQNWSPRKVKDCAQRQKGLLAAGFASLRRGGTLVYSTCSLSPEENEAVVNYALRRFGDQIAIEPTDWSEISTQPGLINWTRKPYDERLAQTCRVLPDDHYDAFYIAKLKRM